MASAVVRAGRMFLVPSENRTVTIANWPAPHEPWNGLYNCPRYSDFNSWQDNGIRGLNFSGCAKFSGWKGSAWQFAQRGPVPTSGSTVFSLFNDQLTTRAYADRWLDTRYRIVLMKAWTVSSAAALIQGGSHDPNTHQNSPEYQLFWTGAGASIGNPPTGVYWTPSGWSNIYIFAESGGNGFVVANYSGSSIYICMTGWVFESDDGTGNGEPEERRIYTQNLYQSPKADQMNRIQDRRIFAGEADGSTFYSSLTDIGASAYYGQWTYDGTSTPPLTVLDSGRDWRKRMNLTFIQRVTSAAELPGGASYDPDTSLSKTWDIWYTDIGTDPSVSAPTAPTDVALTDGNVYYAAARANLSPVSTGDFFARVSGGSDRFGMLLNIQYPARP